MTLYGPEYRYGRRLRWWELLRLALKELRGLSRQKRAIQREE